MAIQNPYVVLEAKKFGLSFAMRKFVLQGKTENEVPQEDEFTRLCLLFLKRYQWEMRHRLGLVDDAYADDFERLADLKTAIRAAEIASAVMRQKDWQKANADAQMFYDWIRASASDLTKIVWGIEQDYPERMREFDADRQKFADEFNEAFKECA